MSSGDEQNETVLKGGHPPADKIAGGVRIARKTRVTSESDKNNPEKTVKETTESEASAQRDSDDQKLTKYNENNVLANSELAAQTKRDYPEEAIRAYHEKPIPKTQKPVQKSTIIHLFQPSKQ